MRRYLGDMPFVVLQEGEGGGGGGGGGSRAEIEATVRRLLSEKGANEAVFELLKDNFQQREELRTLKASSEGMQKVPQGGIVLDATQAAAWKQYQELGKPEDLKKAVEEKATLETEVSKTKWERGADAVAEAHGFQADVLKKLPGADKLRFEVREELVDGEKSKVGYVTTDQQGATPQRVTDYADANWKEFMPALQAEAAEGGEGDDQEARRMVPQRPRGKPVAKGALPAEKVQDRKRRDRRYSSL